jgi:hypothetical protein
MTQVESDAQLGSIPETTPAMRRAAALTVVSHATDKDDARQLLAMLGLDGGES